MSKYKISFKAVLELKPKNLFHNMSKREYLIYKEQPIEANLAYNDIYSSAKNSIYVVDNYINLKTLVLLKNIKSTIDVIIFSDNINKGLHQVEYQDFVREYPDIKISLQKTNEVVHDRYIFIDWNTKNKRIFHCGGSSKDAGKKITTISELTEHDAYNNLITILLKNQKLKLK